MMNQTAGRLIDNTSWIQLDHCSWLAGYQLRHSNLIKQWKESGFFQDDDILDINCFWLQFEPMSLINHFIVVCIFVVIMLMGTLANFISIYILASSKHLRTPANLIIINLAVSDFVMLAKMPIFLYNSFLQGPALGSRGCEIYGFLSGLTGTTSIISLAFVSVDRYLVISHPLNINKKPTRTRAYLIIICIWIYSAIFASLPLFGIGKYVPEGYLTSCSFDYLSDDTNTRIFILSFFVAAWVVPFVIISSCYAAIVWNVRKARKELDRQQCNRHTRNCPAGYHQNKIELVIAKIAIILVLLWMISWTPYAFVALIGISGYYNNLSPGVTMAAALFAKCSAFFNPIVYTLSHPKIRKEIFRRWYNFMSSRTYEPSPARANSVRDLVSLRPSRQSNMTLVVNHPRSVINSATVFPSHLPQNIKSMIKIPTDISSTSFRSYSIPTNPSQRVSLVPLSDRPRRKESDKDECFSVSATIESFGNCYRYSQTKKGQVIRRTSEPSSQPITVCNSSDKPNWTTSY